MRVQRTTPTSRKQTEDIAIVQLASWGDVLISTCVVRALKEQRKCKLTYYVSSACMGAVVNNPDIDRLTVIDATKDQAWGYQDGIIRHAKKQHDLVITPWAGFLPQEKWVRLDRTCEPNFMYAYARAAQEQGLTVPDPFAVYLYPTEAEKQRAAAFEASLQPGLNVLMEIEGHSSQTYWSPGWLGPVVDTVFATLGDQNRLPKLPCYNVNILISRGGPSTPEIDAVSAKYPGRVHLLNHYSLREVSVIFNDCDYFLGCSSGTSNACHGHLCGRQQIRWWFEALRSPIWNSTPLLGCPNKEFYYGADLGEYLKLLRAGLTNH